MRRALGVLVGTGLLALGIGCSCPPGTPAPVCGAWVLTPAKYQAHCEQVLVKPGGMTREWVPPIFETRCEQVLVAPGRWCETPIAPTYETVAEKVCVAPCRKEWRRVACTVTPVCPGEVKGDSYCLVDVPPIYETRYRRVQVSPPGCARVWVPPAYKTVERRVQVGGGCWREIGCPPCYEPRVLTHKVAESQWEFRASACPPPPCPAPCPPPCH